MPQIPEASKKLLVLDRDGVINYESPQYIKRPEEWIPLPGSLEAIARLSTAGYRIAVVTNQAGVGHGLFSDETLQAIHAKMLQAIFCSGGKVERIYYCPHPPEAGCECRKPKPGMLKQAQTDFGLTLVGVPVVGDTLRDLLAARAMEAQPVLVLTGYGRETLSGSDVPDGTLIYDDLAAFADALLG
jgi:D-glycero-D-manno-heptose 1,7-bisphosphate phosphatase